MARKRVPIEKERGISCNGVLRLEHLSYIRKLEIIAETHTWV